MRFKLLAFITAFALMMTLTCVAFADTTEESGQSDDGGEGIEVISDITITAPEPDDSAIVPGVDAPAESPSPTPTEAATSEPSVQITEDSSATAPPRVMPTRARYELRHGDTNYYDEQTKVYTLDLYLVSDEYITTGSVGIEFDSMLANDFDFGTGFTVDDNFSIVRPLAVGKNYFVFTWKIKPDASDYIGDGDGLHIGELKIKNVELNGEGVPEGWHTETFRILDWYTTSESADSFYADYEDGVCLNDEIYNKSSGWYQGMSFGKVNSSDDIDPDSENWYEWIDIGFLFDVDNLPVRADRVIEGTINGYNSATRPTAKLLSSDDESVGTTEIEHIDGVNDDYSYSWAYKITLDTEVQPGEYTLVVSKDVHLTYKETLTVGNDAETYSKNIELYCGDIGGAVDAETNKIIGDEKIKQNDRTILIQHLNRSIDSSIDLENALAVRCDLNGDGKVTLHDLIIMKKYYNKTYQ